MKKILFLCSQNRLRSPTAEAVFSVYRNIDVQSAGLNDDADYPLGLDEVLWADIIIVMEDHHRRNLKRKFGKYLKEKKVYVLNIPDMYPYMDPELVEVLKNKVPKLIGL